MLSFPWAGALARTTSTVVCTAIFFAAGLAMADRSLAHEGHDHGAPTITLPANINPRAVATGDEFEAVAILKDGTLLIFVDRFADNAPAQQAVVTVTIGTADTVATPSPDGAYRVAWPAELAAGRHDVVIGIQEGTVGDLLITQLDLPATTTVTTAGPSSTFGDRARQWFTAVSPLSALGGMLVAALAVAVLRRRGPERRRDAPIEVVAHTAAARSHASRASLVTLIAITVVSTVLVDRPAAAETAGAAAVAVRPAPVTTGDSPRRFPDGRVFLPKPTQRLLDVRTVLVTDAQHRASQTLVGRVIANPNRSGLVQSSVGGRVSPPAAGLPKLGQAVRAGDVLGYVTPAFQAIDSANVAQTAGELEQQSELARAKLERARRLLAVNAGSRVQAEEAELLLQGLERRRAALGSSQIKAEALIAPVDGVISSARAVPGQVAAPQDVLFEIIDGRSLWVEALVFESGSSQTFETPTASTQDGEAFPLTFVGRSRSLRQQSAIVHFEIAAPPASLDVGAPVTVHTQSGEPITGIVLSRAAVVRSANGEDIVWRHTEPEWFAPTPVRIRPFDGTRVLVQAGLAAGQRIVVQSAELISQVR